MANTPTELPGETYQLARDYIGPGPLRWITSKAATVADAVVATDASLISLGRTARVTTEALFLGTVLRLLDPSLGRLMEPLMVQLVRGAMLDGASLTTVLRALNHGQAGIAEALLVECERRIPAGDHGSVMRALVSNVVSTHNHFADVIAHRDLTADDQASFPETESGALAALLSGHGRPERFEQITRYSLDRIHVAAVAFSERLEPDKLLTAATQALEGMGCGELFTVMVAPNVLWAWGSVSIADDLQLEFPAQCRGWTMAVGLPGRGTAGFIASHDEAKALQRVAMMAGGRNLGRTLPYERYGAVVELAARPDRLKRFLEAQLGALLGGGGRERDLRSTMLEYLNVNRSQYAAAERLHVSKNTVSYRLHRAEEILGRSIGEDLAPLHTALLAADILGSPFPAQVVS